jgi:hypothetical protein
MTSVTARARWQLIRHSRFRRALTALGDGRAEDALGLLSHIGAAGDDHADVLTTVAMVMASPSLPNAERCVAALERSAHQSLDPEILTAASVVLQTVLRQEADSPAELVAYVAQVTGRLMRITGPVPWGGYNIAIDALRRGEFKVAADHLGYGATARSGSWPPSLLSAACAAILGDSVSLSCWLAESVDDPAFYYDVVFLTAVSHVLQCLLLDRTVKGTWVAESLSGPSGPLTQLVPQLFAVKTLLADVIRGTPTQVTLTELGGCAWGQWLCGRLRYASNDVREVLAPSGPAADDPVLRWEYLGSQQDFTALLSEETARGIRRRLADLAHGATGTAPWARLTELRLSLADDGSGAELSGPAAAPPYPWQIGDEVLQAVTRHDSETERGYLEGRRALRQGDPAAARRCFEVARTRISGEGLATRVTALRFGPLLDYWEGVTLAHLGLGDKATQRLRACANDVKSREARAQLGLLAVASGDHAAATRLLETIPEPRPAAADYLGSLLTERADDAGAAAHLSRRFAGREVTAGIYVTAWCRLQGRVHETKGELAEASRWYRQALARRPRDRVAAARLARVWLRQRYDGTDLPAEPLLNWLWSASADDNWCAPLLLVRECLDGHSNSARELLGRVPADPTLRLLALRSAVARGEEPRAAQAAQAWAWEDGADPRLTSVGQAARAATLLRNFCLAGGLGPPALELTRMEQDLRAGTQDPVTAYWAAVTRLMLEPESLAASGLAADEAVWSAPLRLFAGLLSVFSADSEQRRAAAVRCRAALDDLDVELARDSSARAVVRCLAADALGDDEDFLAAYGEIESQPQVLPWGPEASYLAATEARLRRGDLDAIIDGSIPEALADLAHPGVRRAIAIAYARRATLVAESDARAALRDIGQARELLRESP